MLELKDLYHLPQLEPFVEQLVSDGPGLIVVAGLDLHTAALATSHSGTLPSGRSAILRILMRQILVAHPGARAIVVAESQESVRIPREFRRRIQPLLVQPSESYADAIEYAAGRRPDLLVVDRLTASSATAALEAARRDLRVLSQLDTLLRGAEVARHLMDLGVPSDLLGELVWVVAVCRLATLCPHCKEPVSPDSAELDALMHRFGDAAERSKDGIYYRPVGCPQCHFTGRAGEIAAFDVFCAEGERADPLAQASLLPMEAYLLGLAARGYLPLEDALTFEGDRLRQACGLLATGEQALAEAESALERRSVELQAANRVLQQRTEALISLESIGQALISATSLSELAAQLCRSARDLCGADRSILYYLRPEQGIAEVLAVHGWDATPLGEPLEAALVCGTGRGVEPMPFNQQPPGVPRRATDVTAAALRAGLSVPLLAQEEQVGVMIVHTSQKPRFTPGDVALLQTFANQAAVAIQRAGLVEALQDKIQQLEAAQAELVQKERMERELELARQVQQSVLPRAFPAVPGYRFAARSEPARWVGGDFYDLIQLDGSRFGLVIGDVSDKGMPAALFMARAHSLLLAEARREPSPRAVLRNVHRLLRELGRPEMFVTVFYGVVDGPDRRLTYARAGHERPVLLHKGEVQILAGEGIFLGFPELDELHLSEEHQALRSGDRLVLYTDGLTDVRAPDGRSFGRDRWVSLLQSYSGLPLDDLCAATFTDLAAFQDVTEQFDDMTLLVMEVE